LQATEARWVSPFAARCKRRATPPKPNKKIGWVTEITALEMCAEMIAADLAQAKQHALLKANVYNFNVRVE
jgi:GDPmannose 4,6-dehydratase